jgi:hypothetical protein
MGWSMMFPDCSVCKCMSDDGGFLDKENRFWVCIDCDDWLDDVARKTINTEIKYLTHRQVNHLTDYLEMDDDVITYDVVYTNDNEYTVKVIRKER